MPSFQNVVTCLPWGTYLPKTIPLPPPPPHTYTHIHNTQTYTTHTTLKKYSNSVNNTISIAIK